MRAGHVITGLLPDRITDLLTIEGGSWSAEEIALRLDANPKSVEKALYRMLARGDIQRRLRPFPPHEWRVR